MVRRFWWCALVALLVLLSIAAGEGVRSSQTENQKQNNGTRRGISRFNARTLVDTLENASIPTTRTKSSRDRSFQFRKSSTAKPIEEKTTSGTLADSEINISRSKSRLTRTTERSNALKPVHENVDTNSNFRGRSSGRQASDSARVEPVSSRRSDRRYSSSDDDVKKVKSNRNEASKDRHGSRRTGTNNENEKLDSFGPSVFTGAPDRSSLRAGRKIQNSFSSKDLKKQIPASRRFENQTDDNEETTAASRRRSDGRNNGSNKRQEKNRTKSNRSRANIKEVDNSLNRKGQDVLSESESIRVDIPLAVGGTNPSTTTSQSLTSLPSVADISDRSGTRHASRNANRRSDTKETLRNNAKETRTNERQKTRGRVVDSEVNGANTKSSRRGSSRFNDFSTTEPSEQLETPRSRNGNVRERSRSDARSRSRGSLDAANGFSGQEARRRSPADRSITDRRSRVAESKQKTLEHRKQEEEPRGRSRGKPRVDVTTSTSPASVTTVASIESSTPEATTISSTEAEMMITTISSIPSTTSTTTTTRRPSTVSSTTVESSTRGRGRGRGSSQGRTPPREDYFNHGLGFRGRKVSTEASPTSGETRRSNTQRNDTQNRGNPGWTLRRRPGNADRIETTTQIVTPPKDQTNEIIPPNEQITSTEVITKIETSTSTLRRGSKKQKTSEENTTKIESTTKAPRRGNRTFDKGGLIKTSAESAESDNYPPEFKAKLSQLKTDNIKLPTPKSSSRALPEAKKSSAALFAERSRMKLELARRLVKPELNVEENDLEHPSNSGTNKQKSSEISTLDDKSKIAIKADDQSVQSESVTQVTHADDAKSIGKLSRIRKGSEEGEEITTRLSALKKGRIISERMVTSISVEEGKHLEQTTKPYQAATPTSTIISTEGVSETTIASTRAKLFGSHSSEKINEASNTPLSRGSRYVEKLSSTTPRPKKSYTQTRGNKNHSQERRDKFSSEEITTKKSKSAKTGFRPRYSKRVKQKSLEDQNEIEYQVTTTQRSSTVTSRYMRKKVELKSVEDKSKFTSIESNEKQNKRREFRPRTATYRRHSEIPTTLTEATTKAGVTGVAITPRSSRYQATLKTSTTAQPTIQEPQVRLTVSNESVPQPEGITDSSNGDSGNTNIFNPTRSVFLTGNATLLEQLRSTVAPLLSSLGNKSPIFAGAYSNVNVANSAPRITPSGSPPRFSARYKGAELFVRKPGVYQATVPPIITSSTTPSSLLENSGAVPPVDVSSPGEPQFLTIYHAVESVSIKNEQLQGDSRDQLERVAQVDSNATSPIGSDNGNLNNDTTSPIIDTTMSSQTPSDTTVITNQSDNTLTPRVSETTENANPMVTMEASDLQNNMDSTPTVEQTSTEPNLESTSTTGLPQIDQRIGGNSLAETTTSSTTSQDSMSTVDLQMTVTTSVPTTVMNLESELSSNDINDDSMNSLGTTTIRTVESSTVSDVTTSMGNNDLLDATTASVDTKKDEIQNLFDSPESNAIEGSDGSTTARTGPVTSSDAPTTETVSNNIIDAQTTEVPITSTFRNRLIDFAQDILSRLQETIGSTTVPTGGFTTTVLPTEISNVITDSRSNGALESLSQLRDIEATTRSSMNDATELTTVQNTLIEMRESSTTALPTTEDQSSVRMPAEGTTSQSATDSVTTWSPNTATPSAESSTQIVENTEASTVTDERMSNIVSNDGGMVGNVQDSSTDVGGLENSSGLPLDTEITTVSMASTQSTTLENDARTSNDTLLTELMTIAKTLFSEAMNETQQLLTVQSATDGSSDLPAVTLSTRLETMNNSTDTPTENEVDQAQLSTETTPIVKLSTPASLEYVDSTQTTTVGPTSEIVNTIQTTTDISESDIESRTNSSVTTLPEISTTLESRIGMDLSESNDTVNLEVPTTDVQMTTVLPEVGSEVETSELLSTTLANAVTDPDTMTQSQTNSTQTTEATVMPTVNFELTTNTYDLQSRILSTTNETPLSQTTVDTTIDPTTILTDATESTQSVNTFTESTTMSVTSETVTGTATLTTTNQPFEITTPMVVTVPESILSRVNTFSQSPSSAEMTTEASVNIITESEVVSEKTTEETTVPVTTESVTEVVVNITNDTGNTTNQTIDPTTEVTLMSLNSDTTRREPTESTTTAIITTESAMTSNANFVEAIESTTNQPPLTMAPEPSMDVVSNPATTTEATNTPDETTTTAVPQTTQNLENETPTVVARFQDATSATAQGTAGSGIGQSEQTTETNIPTTTKLLFIPETPATSTIPSTQSSSIDTTTSSSVEMTTTTTRTTTTTETATITGRLEGRIPTTESSGMDVFTVTALSVNTTPTETTSANVEDNLISSNASATDSTTAAVITSTENLNIVSRNNTEESSTMSTTPQANVNTTESSSTVPTMMPSSSPTRQPLVTTPYMGRFGGSRITPAPRFSPSSTTKAPLRDYLIYGIYPNKTIVRKRPEDNLIDARNVDSPYVIFGIFPDGRLVRKFPNGTIIPDPPTNPVEVVFSLSTTTTTNRPMLRPYYNQANQGTYSQYQAPAYNNNPRPAVEMMRNIPSPGTVDLGLTGNAIVSPNGGGPDYNGPLGSPASTGKMSDVLLNTRGGLSGNIASAIAGLLTPITSTGAPVRAATDSQGGRIVVDRERDEATRTKEAGGQRSSVYIGQDKFVNYWTNDRPNSNPRVLSVNINSVATATNVGSSSSSSSVPSFENLLNNEQGGQVTAPPGFPWRDPLDQILGITTSSPVITASVASNTLEDSSESNVPIAARPVNPFVEVFTPVSSTAPTARISSSTPEPTTTTTAAASTATPPPPPPTTTTTTTTTPSTTTAEPTTTPTPPPGPTQPNVAFTTASSPTPGPTSAASNGGSAQAGIPTTASPAQVTMDSPQPDFLDASNKLLANMQKQNAFGTTFDDLAFLNSLLQAQNIESTTAKTLTEVEQLLANKILSLALNNPGASRSSKAIQFSGASANSFDKGSAYKSPTSGPIVIDLFPSSTAASPTWKPSVTQLPSQKLVESTLAPDLVTWKPVSSTTTATKRDSEPSTLKTIVSQTVPTSTKAPVVITSKPVTTPRPRTTTSVPFSFGAGLWQALFGGNLFGSSTPSRTAKQNIRQSTTTPRPVQITPKSVSTTQWPTQGIPSIVTSTVPTVMVTATSTASPFQQVDISKIQAITPNSILSGKRNVDTASSSISTTNQPFLNNPNPRLPGMPTSTFSPEDDAKFLATLLRALQTTDTKGSSSKSAPQLSSDDEQFLRAILSGQTTTTTTTPSPEINNAALLAALLKAQGIEPPMPASKLREQLQMASLGQSITSATSGSTTTTTTRPSSTTERPTAITKNTATTRPTSRPRTRTTTWSPSSTYPPPLFSSFSNYGARGQSNSNADSGNNGLFSATRAFSQFLGAAISGAAQQLQSIVRNGTRIVSDVVG